MIKCGAFDIVEKKPREQIMNEYLDSIIDKKEKLTLQNMQMLINKELIPEEMLFYQRLFLFNKFLKTQKYEECYKLNESAINFIDKNFDIDIIIDGTLVKQTIWDNIYKKTMDPMRIYLKQHKDEILKKLNDKLYQEVSDKYATGNISKWEMESVSFYSHEHELAAAAKNYDDFFSLPEEPEIDYTFTTKDGQIIHVLKLHKILGTVIDKNKIKNTVTLLTPTGVVNVKVYKNQYALFDKQLSQMGDDGHKHVIEPSWFKRGTLLMVQGIRRGADFVPKKRKDSVFPVITKITAVDGEALTFQYDRAEVDE